MGGARFAASRLASRAEGPPWLPRRAPSGCGRSPRAPRAAALLLASAMAAALFAGCASTPTLPADRPVPPARPTQGVVVERIVAIVDGEVITLGQIERAVALAQEGGGDNGAPLCGRAPAPAAASFEQRVLECMIDSLLMFQHVRRFPQFGVIQEQIDEAFAALVAGYESREAFEEDLERQGLTAAEVRYDLEREALVSNYIDTRYRSIVDIRDSELRRYYDEVFVPEMQRQGQPIPSFEAVAPRIRPILSEAEVNRRVEAWIADLRRRADIVVYLW